MSNDLASTATLLRGALERVERQLTLANEQEAERQDVRVDDSSLPLSLSPAVTPSPSFTSLPSRPRPSLRPPSSSPSSHSRAATPRNKLRRMFYADVSNKLPHPSRRS